MALCTLCYFSYFPLSLNRCSLCSGRGWRWWIGNQGGHWHFIESGWVGMGLEVVGRELGQSLVFAFHRVSVGGVGGGGGG